MNRIANYYQQYREALQAALTALVVEDAKGNWIEPEAGFMQLCKLSALLRDSSRTQFFCGNGASAALCNHMTLDWSKNGKVPTRSFSDAALLTAVANDLGADQLFAAPLAFYARAGDLLVTISSSGNSPNILSAITKARELSMSVVTFSGLKPDNASRKLGDINFYIPAKTYGMVESAHAVLLHVWLDRFMGITEWEREAVQNMRWDAHQP